MISVAEARAIILGHGAPMHEEHVPLAEAHARTLYAPIMAQRAQPPFNASAMDGYAVRGADTPGPLRVIGEAGAGRALTRPLLARETARVFTGAPLPEGADAVLMQEDAERTGDQITAPRVEPHRHVRAAGVDFAAGARLLETGRMLDGPALALAAAAGCATVSVFARPRIAILSGGDEIVPLGVVPRPDQIFDSVSYGVAGLAAAWGASATTSAPLADNRDAIAAKVEAALAVSDLIVLIGGASVGDHDHARPALASISAEILFEKVAVRPGKPTWFARRGDKLILGLPGNPASAMVCAHLFLRPLIERMLGRDPSIVLTPQAARLSAALPANGARETYLRATTRLDASGQLWAESLANQDSSLMLVFAAANAFIVQAPSAPAKDKGDLVPVLPF